MKSNELIFGNIYTDRDGVSAFRYIGTSNSTLYEFEELEYDEKKGKYVKSKIPYVHYFNKFEISDLIELK